MVDLFATSMTHRLPLYMSPQQDPQAIAVDAMLQPWDGLFVYAFPPFSLMSTKQTIGKRTHILVASWWPEVSGSRTS